MWIVIIFFIIYCMLREKNDTLENDISIEKKKLENKIIHDNVSEIRGLMPHFYNKNSSADLKTELKCFLIDELFISDTMEDPVILHDQIYFSDTVDGLFDQIYYSRFNSIISWIRDGNCNNTCNLSEKNLSDLKRLVLLVEKHSNSIKIIVKKERDATEAELEYLVHKYRNSILDDLDEFKEYKVLQLINFYPQNHQLALKEIQELIDILPQKS